MIQGSNMTRSHKGMRKGISLVEMLTAIVLFGLIATISYTYYKNYYDTSFASKQLKVYTIIDQAAQLSNAFDLYNTKNGQDINITEDLVTDRELTQIPQAIPQVTLNGWQYEDNMSLARDATIGTGKAFIYDLNSTISSRQDKLDYCNILQNTAYNTWEHNLSAPDSNITTSYINWHEGNDTAASEQEFFHCSRAEGGTAGDYDYRYVFVKRPYVD